MKHLFNDISQEEKQRILEMHGAKKSTLSEQLYEKNASFVPYGLNCTKNCGQSKFDARQIRMIASRLKNLYDKAMQVFNVDRATGNRWSYFIDEFKKCDSFEDLCLVNEQYKTMSNKDLWTSLDKIKSVNTRADLQMFLNQMTPCGSSSSTPTTEPTPSQQEGVSLPPIA